MKKISITTLLIIFFFSPFAQTKKNDPLAYPFKIEKDTMYAMVDFDGTMQNLPWMPYIRKWWPQDGKYRELLFHNEGEHLVRMAWYLDKDCKEKDGIYEVFHKNGITEDSGRFEKNVKQGTFKGWHENGNQSHIFHYRNGLPVDTGYTFRDDGTMASVSITDQQGNGKGQDYHTNGKVKMLGPLNKGERDGTWLLKREDGTKMMQLTYIMDSVAQTLCFNEDGITPAKGDCVFEKPAEFPGGVKGWTAFLSKNLKYPNYAVDKNIEGVVRVQFIVNKDGTIDEFKILKSPHETLSKEVLRLMNKSPNWVPAIQYNQKVNYRHIQAITFRLE